MTAGVPGLGLGGLFALVAALCLPIFGAGSKRGVARLFGMALVIVSAALLAWQSVSWFYTVVSSGQSEGSAHHLVKSGPGALTQPVVGQLFGVPVLVISLALMTTLLLGGELLLRVVGVRLTPLPPPIPGPTEALHLTEPTSRPRVGAQESG